MYTLLLLFTVFSTAFGQCYLGDDAYVGGLCYTASTYKATYLDAEFACNGKQQSLAIIWNSAQANYLATVVKKITNDPYALFWIGLKRKTMGSRWQWEDGTPFSWSNFDSNYLQNNLYVAESTMNGKWRTLDGQEQHYFVCSYDPNLSPSTTWQPGTSTDFPVSDSTYYPWSTDFPGKSTTYSPYTTGYPSSDSTYYPGESTTYSPYTTDYPFSESTYYPGETTPYPGTTYYPGGTTDYPNYDSTYYPGGTTDYPDASTTDFFRGSKRLSKRMKKLLRK